MDPAPVSQEKSQFKIQFSLAGAPGWNKFVDRPDNMRALDEALLPGPIADPSISQECRIFVLCGMGGIGKTQLAVNFAWRNKQSFDSIFWLKGNSETDLRQSLCDSVKRVPQLSKYRGQVLSDAGAQQQAIDDMLDWLRNEDNDQWLLVFDNVDLDHDQEKDRERGAYNINKYLPSCDHGSVLITTRLWKLEQLGGSDKIDIVDADVGRKIFQNWNGNDLRES